MQESRSAILQFITAFFETHEDDTLIYHNLYHTQAVIQRAEEISDHYALSERDRFTIFVAAAFHDLGHLVHAATGHEQASVGIMRDYFQGANLSKKIVDDIAQCIFATELPSEPKTLCEKIICDADLYHLGTDEFFVTNELVKKEIETKTKTLLAHWNERSLAFLLQHHFHTAYCNEILAGGKRKNIEFLQKIISRS